MQLHSSTHLWVELFWDLRKISRLSTNLILKTIFQLTVLPTEWYSTRSFKMFLIHMNRVLDSEYIAACIGDWNMGFPSGYLFQVISAAGAVKHEDIVEQVKKTFTKLSANPSVTSQLVAEKPAVFTGSEVCAWYLNGFTLIYMKYAFLLQRFQIFWVIFLLNIRFG